MSKTLVFGAILGAALATPAMAGPVDNSSSASIEPLAQVARNDGGVHAELAAAYMREGKLMQARSSYQRVLKLDNVMLETPRGDAIWSHEVAKRALASTSLASL